jgi:tetratricopeptide (TPR) repeat protein
VAGYGSTLARSDPSLAVAWFSEHLPATPGDQEQVIPWLSAQYAYVGALNRLRDYEALDIEALHMRDVVDAFEVTNPRTLGRLSQQLANVARRHGDSVAEARHWREAVDYMRQADSAAALAVALNNQAIFLGRNGRYPESEAAFREAIAVYENAGHEDASLAGVLRGYGGLQFRMRQPAAAIDTTRRALALLETPSEAYARFITSLNLVRYQFVAGDLEPMLPTMISSLEAALSELGTDSPVPLRMRTLFAKALVFAGDFDNAARTLGFDTTCNSALPYLHALDALEHSSEQEDRETIWTAVDGLKPAGGATGPSNPQQVLQVMAEHAPFFFDVLDQWRVLDAVMQTGGSVDIPEDVVLKHQDLTRLSTESGELIQEHHAAAVAELASWFQAAWETPRVCLDNT